MSKFTCGPWTLCPLTGNIHSGQHSIGQVYGATKYNYEPNADECMSNARLVIHAPEMYTLLRDLAETTPDARKLIALIDGETEND